MTYQPFNTKTAFLPTSRTFPENQASRIIEHTSTYIDTANAVNVREIAIYQDQQEILTGQQWSIPGDTTKKYSILRKAIYFGAIAAGATLTVAHGIPNLVECTLINGTCITAVPDYRPIPFADTANVTNQISILVTPVNLVITNGATAPNITSGKAVIEYIRN